jgi:hypothetical protein
MRLAWFRPGTGADSGFDDLRETIAALASEHTVDVVSEARAHDFVWMEARRPYDLCVFELDDTPAHHYVFPYVLHYPGVLALRTGALHASRTTLLMHRRRRRDYEVEMAFSEGPQRPAIPWHVARGTRPLLRVPTLASRAVVVADQAWADSLQRAHPDARIRYVPVGVAGPVLAETGTVAAAGASAQSGAPGAMRVAVVDGRQVDVVDRAIARVSSPEVRLERLVVLDAASVSARADIVVALGRPALGVPIASALSGMAAALPVIVAETETTAGWPALDPQTWQPRGYKGHAPSAVISIDPRDEEHSLVLALRRLAVDAALRRTLGAGGHAWWTAHHTLARAAERWHVVLREAATLTPPRKPPDWPAHLTADGTERARAILGEFGLDFEGL